MEIRSQPDAKLQCNKTALYMQFTKKLCKQIPADEIVVVTENKTYRIWGLLNSAELVSNIQNAIG